MNTFIGFGAGGGMCYTTGRTSTLTWSGGVSGSLAEVWTYQVQSIETGGTVLSPFWNYIEPAPWTEVKGTQIAWGMQFPAGGYYQGNPGPHSLPATVTFESLNGNSHVFSPDFLVGQLTARTGFGPPQVVDVNLSGYIVTFETRHFTDPAAADPTHVYSYVIEIYKYSIAAGGAYSYSVDVEECFEVVAFAEKCAFNNGGRIPGCDGPYVKTRRMFHRALPGGTATISASGGGVPISITDTITTENTTEVGGANGVGANTNYLIPASSVLVTSGTVGTLTYESPINPGPSATTAENNYGPDGLGWLSGPVVGSQYPTPFREFNGAGVPTGYAAAYAVWLNRDVYAAGYWDPYTGQFVVTGTADPGQATLAISASLGDGTNSWTLGSPVSITGNKGSGANALSGISITDYSAKMLALLCPDRAWKAVGQAIDMAGGVPSGVPHTIRAAAPDVSFPFVLPYAGVDITSDASGKFSQVSTNQYYYSSSILGEGQHWNSETFTDQNGATVSYVSGSPLNYYDTNWQPMRVSPNNGTSLPAIPNGTYRIPMLGEKFGSFSIRHKDFLVVDPLTSLANWTGDSGTTLAIIGGGIGIAITTTGLTGTVTRTAADTDAAATRVEPYNPISAKVQDWSSHAYIQFSVMSHTAGSQPFTFSVNGKEWYLTTGPTPDVLTTLKVDLCNPDNVTIPRDLEDSLWPFPTVDGPYSGVSNVSKFMFTGLAGGEVYTFKSDIRLITSDHAVMTFIPTMNGATYPPRAGVAGDPDAADESTEADDAGVGIIGGPATDNDRLSYFYFIRHILAEVDGRIGREEPYAWGENGDPFHWHEFSLSDLIGQLSLRPGWECTDLAPTDGFFNNRTIEAVSAWGAGSTYNGTVFSNGIKVDVTALTTVAAQALWDTVDWYPGCGDIFSSPSVYSGDPALPVAFSYVMGSGAWGLVLDDGGTRHASASLASPHYLVNYFTPFLILDPTSASYDTDAAALLATSSPDPDGTATSNSLGIFYTDPSPRPRDDVYFTLGAVSSIDLHAAQLVRTPTPIYMLEQWFQLRHLYRAAYKIAPPPPPSSAPHNTETKTARYLQVRAVGDRIRARRAGSWQPPYFLDTQVSFPPVSAVDSEPRIMMVVADGTVRVLFTRTVSGASSVVESVSHDQGVTWTPVVLAASAKHPVITEGTRGAVLRAWYAGGSVVGTFQRANQSAQASITLKDPGGTALAFADDTLDIKQELRAPYRWLGHFHISGETALSRWFSTDDCQHWTRFAGSGIAGGAHPRVAAGVSGNAVWTGLVAGTPNVIKAQVQRSLQDAVLATATIQQGGSAFSVAADGYNIEQAWWGPHAWLLTVIKAGDTDTTDWKSIDLCQNITAL